MKVKVIIMFYLSENIRKYRMKKNLTQEELAALLGLTPQAISKWERAESYPDITLLPALANILETSIDLLIGMDTIRAEQTRYNIHSKATDLQRAGDYAGAEKVYRDALLIYPNKPGMLLGLAGVLALQGKSEDAIAYIERGLPLSENEKQKATMRAVLCFLYLQCGMSGHANSLASTLPHMRESREVIQPLVQNDLDDTDIKRHIKVLLLGEDISE